MAAAWHSTATLLMPPCRRQAAAAAPTPQNENYEGYQINSI
jgi:hypothetical protein